jgi:hypothetical protein
VESDVNATLGELERKLKELEQELESVGRGGETDAEPAQAGWTPPADADVAERPQPAAAPPPPPPGATPVAASWHGTAEPAAPPPPPASPFNGGSPVPVTPPPAPWSAAPEAAPPAHVPPPPAPPPPAWTPPPIPSRTATLHRQLDELLEFRDRLVRTTDDLVAELSRVLTELGVEQPDPASALFTGHVVVEAEPFGDLATLSAFEQALMRVPGVVGVHVRTLDQGRATVDVELSGPVALGAALRATAPVAFTVTAAGDGRLALSLAA